MDFQSLKVDEQLNDNDFKLVHGHNFKLVLERKEVKKELIEIIGKKRMIQGERVRAEEMGVYLSLNFKNKKILEEFKFEGNYKEWKVILCYMSIK